MTVFHTHKETLYTIKTSAGECFQRTVARGRLLGEQEADFHWPPRPAVRMAHLGIRGGLWPGRPLPAGPLGGRQPLCICGETEEALAVHMALVPGGLNSGGRAPPAPRTHAPADTMVGLALCVHGALLKRGPRPGPQKETRGQQAGSGQPCCPGCVPVFGPNR